MNRSASRPVTRLRRLPLLICLAALVTIVATTRPRAASPDVVISQVYGGGGNSGATLRNDFVELFNRGSAPVSVNGWSVQYASSAGTTWARTPLPNLVLAPGQYLLVQQAAGTGGTAALPTPDATGTIAMSATAGKVALSAANVTLTGACPSGLVDFVGFGAATTCYEGSPTANLSNTTAASRILGGCTDTDVNSADFSIGAPAPRNSASPLSPCAGDSAPTVNTMSPASGAGGVGLDVSPTVTFSEAVNAAAPAFTISCSITGLHSFVLSGGPTTFTLNPDTNFASNESCTVTVLAAQVTDADASDPPDAMAANVSATFTTVEVCGDPSTLIHGIQGNGLTSPLAGQTVSIEGVVIADYQATVNGGFFVQEEAGDIDADPETSEGIFVLNSSLPVSVGDKVRVRGTVFEFQSSGSSLTELTSVSTTLVCSVQQPLPEAVAVTLPVASIGQWERHEGMLISLSQSLTVTETFALARFGEVALSVGGRLLQPTNVVAPGAPALARQDLNDRSRILLDDGNNAQNIDPTIYPLGGLSAANTLRSGDTLQGLTGVLDERFGAYRVQPVGLLAFEAANIRPVAPAAVGGTLKVASFNVLNYFNGNGVGGGFPTSRGANTLAEFLRQRAKTIAALLAMNADIVGLMELENDASGNSAIEDLVAGLNAASAPGTYAAVDTGVLGTDEIRVGLIYKPGVVTPVGSYAVLDGSVDPTFIDTLNRPTLAQTFSQNSNGKRLTVAVNHLKSKGSDCDDVSDPDMSDGQGNCNLTRTKAATALVNWLALDPTSANDPDVLIIGDLNSYAMEDPIAAIKAAGYLDMIGTLASSAPYSYVFGGQSGYLDHALASSVLAPRITGVTEWHINADEPTALDYNVEFKSLNHQNTLYAPDPYRSSDHDPVIVGINLIQPFAFTGFMPPIGDTNVVKSGRAIPVKFGLGGDRGLGIFADGYPASREVSCTTGTGGVATPTASAGGSALTYDPLSDRYSYVWKTEPAWAGTCRQLIVKFADGTSQTATFMFAR